MPSPDPAQDRAALRREMRAARAALPARQVTAAAEALRERVLALPGYAGAATVAGYVAMPGEMDPRPLMRRALDDGKSCFVPLIGGDRLRFAPWTPDSLMAENRFGILEPVVDTAQLLLPQALALVLVPLVAFDARCNRIGMGGGYYDRSFAGHVAGGPPLLAGVAHELQKVAEVAAQPWDVRLDCVVTESHTYWPDQALQPGNR